MSRQYTSRIFIERKKKKQFKRDRKSVGWKERLNILILKKENWRKIFFSNKSIEIVTIYFFDNFHLTNICLLCAECRERVFFFSLTIHIPIIIMKKKTRKQE